MTSTAAELNLLDGSAAGTVVNSKAVIYGSGGEVQADAMESLRRCDDECQFIGKGRFHRSGG